MATNLALDDRLIEEAVKRGKHKPKKEAVTAALVEYIKAQQRLEALTLIGKIEYVEGYDYRKLRKNKKIA
jgi:Arc/MetJ family transcription regulator